MKCSLVGDQARVLAKLLQFLVKIGPDLFIEAQEDGMLLGTANSSSSGYASIKLCTAFFQNYHVNPETIETGDNCCRVALKACVPIFKSLKSVETCDIRMNQGSSKLIIQLHCRENTTKTHFVSILQLETLSAPTRKNSGPMNTLVASQKVFSDILSIFNTTEEELTLDANRKGITMKNYVESIHVNRQQMRTQLCLDPAEFDSYGVETETNVTFCLREWRAFLTLAESLNANIIINFETTGLPIEFTIRDLDVFEVTLFMSTLSSDLDNSRNDSVIIVSDSVPSQVGPTTSKKRTHEATVDEELNALLKKPKTRKKQTQAQESNIHFSNPDIEDYSANNGNGTDSSAINNHNRWTIARNSGEGLLQVPTIAPRVSTLSPRATTTHHNQSNLDIIFLKDTEEDTDATLLSIPMPGDGPPPSSMETLHETVPDADEIPISPAESQSRVKRKAKLALFRRCYDPSFRVSNITGLRILAENSSDEEDHG